MLKRTTYLTALFLLAWCVMTFTHELGHLLGGWVSGGSLKHAELRPWKLPHSHFAPDPHPLVTLWSGPIVGVLLPVAVAAVVGRKWCWFVAQFCMLANGVYLALAWLSGDEWLDTPRLLAAGASPWTIVIYCLATIGIGYACFRRSVIGMWHEAYCVQLPSPSNK